MSPKSAALPSPSPLLPVQMPRSQTMPVTLDGEAREKGAATLEPLEIDTKAKNTTDSSEICLSPSWSDHGEKQKKKDRKRQGRDQKELEKRRRQEEGKQKATDTKAGKRLSKKPPPPAMETQKMPSGLRRNSLISFMSSQPNSQDNSRRSSREEKRHSGISFSSFRRSTSEQRTQSTPADPDHRGDGSVENSGRRQSVVSPIAPRLPSFRFHSRKPSSRASENESAGSEDAYGRDLIAFAYRLEPFAGPLKPEKIKLKSSKPVEIGSTQDHGSSATREPSVEPEKRNPQQYDYSNQSPPRSANAERGMRDNVLRKQGQPLEHERDRSTSISPPKYEAVAGLEAGQIPNGDSPSALRPHLHTRPSHDGSSYVHKQRMYQQQRSIAGFEDEQAIMIANERATEHEAAQERRVEMAAAQNGSRQSHFKEQTTPPKAEENVRDIPNASRTDGGNVRESSARPEPSSTDPRPPNVPSPPKYAVQVTQTPNEGQPQPQGPALRSAGDSISVNKDPTAPGVKADRVLGFRRRSKPPPANISIAEIKPQRPQRPDDLEFKASNPPQSVEQPAKRSKMERMSAQIPFRGRRDSASSQAQSNVKMDESSQNRGHSKTRASSSQPWNDDLPSSLPKSATTAVLSAERPGRLFIETDKQSRTKRERDTKVDIHQSRAQSDTVALSPPSLAPATNTAANPPKPEKSNSELVVSTTTSEGLLRKTSITRPRSNPQLPTSTSGNTLPSLDFLPQLQYQPLSKPPKRQSPTRHSPTRHSASSNLHHSPSPSRTKHDINSGKSLPITPAPPDLSLLPRSPLRTSPTTNAFTPPSPSPTPTTPTTFPYPIPNFTRSSTSITPFAPGHGRNGSHGGLDAKPIAKLFVICCKCKFWHDLPSRLYEAMALPRELSQPSGGSRSRSRERGGKQSGDVVGGVGLGIDNGGKRESADDAAGRMGVEGRGRGDGRGRVETAVTCPWCEHAMTTWCCAGWTTVVYLHERHH